MKNRTPQRNMRISDMDYRSIQRAAEEYRKVTGGSRMSVAAYLIAIHYSKRKEFLKGLRKGD